GSARLPASYLQLPRKAIYVSFCSGFQPSLASLLVHTHRKELLQSHWRLSIPSDRPRTQKLRLFRFRAIAKQTAGRSGLAGSQSVLGLTWMLSCFSSFSM